MSDLYSLEINLKEIEDGDIGYSIDKSTRGAVYVDISEEDKSKIGELEKQIFNIITKNLTEDEKARLYKTKEELE